MVTFKGASRFFSRTSAGKHQLDVSEIRAAFLASEVVAEKISNFRIDRVSKLLAGETPVRMKHEPTALLHILPLAAFSSTSPPDLTVLAKLSSSDFHVMYGHSATHRHFNFDGLIAYDEIMSLTGGTSSASYLQIFRSGAIEAVCTELKSEDASFFPNFIEGRIIEAFSKYLDLLAHLDLSFPLFVAVTIAFVKGQKPVCGERFWDGRFAKAVDRDVLVVPPIAFEERPKEIPLALKPLFDAVWQAGGFPHSPYYDENGKRRSVLR